MAWLLAAAALLGPAAAVAESEIRADVDKDEVALGDVVTLQVTVSSGDQSADVRMPETPDFDVLSRSQSEQLSFSFGGGGQTRFNKVRVYTLVLSPKRAGTFTIRPGRLIVQGKSYETGAIRVRVVPAGGPTRQKPPRLPPQRLAPPASPMPPFGLFPGFGDPEEEDPFAQLFGGGVRAPNESDLFVRAAVDKPRVFVGEQTTFLVYVFSRVAVLGLDPPLKLPKFDGFWLEDLGDGPDMSEREGRNIDGVPYRVYMLRSRTLFPTRAGTIVLDPVEMNLRTGLSPFFAGQAVHRASEAVTVNVQPLPAGAPQGFESVNVGRWRLTADARPVSAALGQPITYTLAVEGVGNVRNLALPKLPPVPGLKIFDPTITEKTASTRSRFGGRRVLEYLVVPERTGRFEIPSVAFTYFDPGSQGYETVHTAAIALEVGAAAGTGAPSAAPSFAGQSPGQNVLAATGLRPIRFTDELAPRGAPLYRRPAFGAALLAPWLLWALFGAVDFARAIATRDDPAARRRRAASKARRRLKLAAKLAHRGHADAFYAEASRVVRDYLADKLGERVTGLTRDELARRLADAGADGAVEAVRATLDACDAGRFAPGGTEAATLGRVLESASEAMAAMEARRSPRRTGLDPEPP